MVDNRISAVWMGLLLFVALAGLSVWADATPATWIRSYTGDAYGAFFDITTTGDGHLLVTGTTYHSQTPTTLGDVLVAALSTDGDILWETTFGGEALDQGLFVERLGDGGFLVFGETESMGAGDRDLYLIRIDAQGGLLWERTYGGAQTEWAKDMIPLADGGFLLIGESNSFNDDFDVYVIRLDAEGDEQWVTTLDSGFNESGTAALEAANGDLLVLAVISYSGGSIMAYRDSRLYRLDCAGNELWNVLYRAEAKQAGDAMAWTTDGDVVIAGLSETGSYSAALFDFWLARVDAETGALQWSLIEGSQYADDYGISISGNPDGNYLVAGLGPGFPMLSFDEAGDVLWIRDAVEIQDAIYGGFAVLEMADGSYFIPGFHYLRRVGDAFDAILLRFVEP